MLRVALAYERAHEVERDQAADADAECSELQLSRALSLFTSAVSARPCSKSPRRSAVVDVKVARLARQLVRRGDGLQHLRRLEAAVHGLRRAQHGDDGFRRQTSRASPRPAAPARARTRNRSSSTPLKNGARSGAVDRLRLGHVDRNDACSKSESIATDGSSIVAACPGWGRRLHDGAHDLRRSKSLVDRRERLEERRAGAASSGWSLRNLHEELRLLEVGVDRRAGVEHTGEESGATGPRLSADETGAAHLEVGLDGARRVEVRPPRRVVGEQPVGRDQQARELEVGVDLAAGLFERLPTVAASSPATSAAR